MIREVLFGAADPPLAWARVAVYTGIVFAAAAVSAPSVFRVVVPNLASDGHAIASLNVAVNRTFCGMPAAASDAGNGKPLFADPAASRQPVREIIAARWGSFDRFCATLTHAFVNNENSLMLLESWTWRIAPDLTLVGIGRVLLTLKLSLLLFFCAVFLRLGSSVVLCVAILSAAFALLARLQQFYAFSVYSFLLCVVMATVALYPLLLSLPDDSRERRLVWPLVAGLWSAFVVNLRTAYRPMCLAFALMYIAAMVLESRGDAVRLRARIRPIAIAVLLFAAAYGVFQYAFIPSSRGAGGDTLSDHTLFHPLLLSIGLPTNAFSQREGIDWEDSVGLTLAHRVDPSAIYLTKEYERALRTYYVGLWKKYPGEMARVYWEKAKLAGTEMMKIDDVPNVPVRFARNMLQLAPNGLWLLSLPIGCAVVSAWRFVRRRRPFTLLLLMMAVGASMLMLESMLIVPLFYLTYHAPLLLLYCSLTFVLFQAALNGIARVR